MGIVSGSRPRVRSSTTEETQTKELSYIDSLKMTVGESSSDGLETPSTDQNLEGRTKSSEDLNNVLQALSLGATSYGVDRKTTIEKTGWSVKSQFNVTKWDKARYAIGIKEVGAWAYDYAQKSGFVSVPFRTPKPIRSVSLHTDEIVPREFNAKTVRPWIRYWLAFNDSQSWVEIAPANAGSFNLMDGVKIPQVIHVNSGVPPTERDPRAGYSDFDVEVNQVRIKAILERPSDAKDSTPVLKGYRLKLVLRGGL